jgi:hypothetical protein
MRAFSSSAGLIALAVAALSSCQSDAPKMVGSTIRPAASASAADVSAPLNAAAQGAVVELPGYPLTGLRAMPWRKEPLPSPQYIISDDPEYIRVPEAVAIRESVQPGLIRLYTYNVNGIKEPAPIDRKINAVIKNLGEGEMTVTFERYAVQPPSGNYFGIAKANLRAFLSNTAGPTYTVPAGQSVPLDPFFEDKIVKKDDLVHGFYEFTIDQPALISVVQTAPEESTAAASERLTEVLPPKSKSGAGRGLFPVSNLRITQIDGDVIDSAEGVQELIIADGKMDAWVTGTDAYTGGEATLKGNYGVIYDIELRRTSSDGRALALVTWNARAGSQWCGGMANTIGVSEGKFPGGLVDTPSDRLTTTGPPEVVLLQVFPPLPPGESGSIRLTYSPPGASCLPTPLIFIPIDP